MSAHDFLDQNASEAGPEVALLGGHSHKFHQNSLQDDFRPIGAYDTRTITKQTFPKLQMNSKFGTFTKKSCEGIEKLHSEINALDQGTEKKPTDNHISLLNNGGVHQEFPSVPNESTKGDAPNIISHSSHPNVGPALNQVSAQQIQIKPSALVSPMMALNTSDGSDGRDIDSQTERAVMLDAKVREDQAPSLREELDQMRIHLRDALGERDQAVAALRAYEELLKRVNESSSKMRGLSTSPLNSASSSQRDASSLDTERLKKRNIMLEKTVDNLEQTIQDTMARMNEIKDVNQELKNVLTDQQDMLAQYKSTIEQKSFEYRDLLAKHETHVDALVTEHKRDKTLLEKQITLLRAEAHMKSLDNERLASECRIKGEQLARMTEMLNELRQSY